MEEEKKEIEENEVVKTPDEEYAKLIRSNAKKSVIIVVLVFSMILMLALVLLYYFNNKDNGSGEGEGNNGTPVVTPEPVANTLSNDEAIKIAKDKIEMANEFNYDDECRERYDETDWCYYASIDEFKNKFYGIYSSQLVYKDVMNEYKSLTSNVWSTNVEIVMDLLSSIPNYVISNNKVYRNSCAIGSGSYSSVAKFTVDSITSDRIKLNYVVMEKEPDIENAKETEREKATIILVKEDNDWKILKATIADMCNGVYTVGIES